jgi:hypothetical protein
MKRNKKVKRLTEREQKEKIGKYIKATADFQHLPTQPHKDKKRDLIKKAQKRADREDL